MQLDIKHICAYAQHQVQVQYEGIINGSEIKLSNAGELYDFLIEDK